MQSLCKMIVQSLCKTVVPLLQRDPDNSGLNVRLELGYGSKSRHAGVPGRRPPSRRPCRRPTSRSSRRPSAAGSTCSDWARPGPLPVHQQTCRCISVCHFLYLHVFFFRYIQKLKVCIWCVSACITVSLCIGMYFVCNDKQDTVCVCI